MDTAVEGKEHEEGLGPDNEGGLNFYVSPMLPHEAQDWEDCLPDFEKLGLLELVKSYHEEYKTRYIRGSAFLKNHKKRIARIVRTVKENIEFRKQQNSEQIFSQHREHLEILRKSLFPAKYLGKTVSFDMKNLDKLELHEQEANNKDYSYKNNRGIIYSDLSECDFKLAKVFTEKSLVEHVTYAMEILVLKARNTWKCNSRLVFVMDLSNLSMKRYYAAYNAGIAKVFSALGENFPESADKILLLHPPMIFSMCFKMLKPFIQPDTVGKIKPVRGSDVLKAIEVEAVDLSNLPKRSVKGGVEEPTYEWLLDDGIIEFSKNEGEKTQEAAVDVVRESFEAFQNALETR